MRRRILAAALAAITMLAIASCGKKQESSVPETTVEQVTERKVLMMGFYEDAEPFSYADENGTYYGFDLEIGKELARRLNVTLNLRAIKRDAAATELQNGTIDFLGNALFLSKDERKGTTKTDTLFTNRQVVVVPADSEVQEQAQLEGKKVGVVKNEMSQAALADKKSLAKKVETQEFDTRADAATALRGYTVDALVMDEAWAYEQMQKGQQLRIVGDALAEEAYTIVLRSQDEALCKKINELIGEMRNDGTLDKLLQKSFGKGQDTLK